MAIVQPAYTSYSTPSAEQSTNTNDLQNTFLKLLTAQIQYQDPLNPMENTEFTAQLAQFTTVEQLQQANTNLGYLQLYMASINNSQALSFIGKEVIAGGNTVYWDGSKAPELNYLLESDASQVIVNVFDENNRLVHTIHGAGGQEGQNKTVWNGVDSQGNQLPEGSYSFQVHATDMEGNQINAITMATGTVEGITFDNGVTYAVVGGQKIPIGDIVEIKNIKEQLSDEPENSNSQLGEKIVDTIKFLGGTALRAAPFLL